MDLSLEQEIPPNFEEMLASPTNHFGLAQLLRNFQLIGPEHQKQEVRKPESLKSTCVVQQALSAVYRAAAVKQREK
jgi:hypothetical protein